MFRRFYRVSHRGVGYKIFCERCAPYPDELIDIEEHDVELKCCECGYTPQLEYERLHWLKRQALNALNSPRKVGRADRIQSAVHELCHAIDRASTGEAIFPYEILIVEMEA